MQAIDEVERLKREGVLAFSRRIGTRDAMDTEVVESVVVALSTPSDPHGKCVEVVQIEWVPHFCNGALAPRVNAESGGAKMLALFPQILAPFLDMENGYLTPTDFIEGLVKVGVLAADRGESFRAPAVICARCKGLFGPKDCKTSNAESAGLICDYCAVETQLV